MLYLVLVPDIPIVLPATCALPSIVLTRLEANIISAVSLFSTLLFGLFWAVISPVIKSIHGIHSPVVNG